MLILIALGGNALLRRGERMDAGVMEENVKHAVAALAPLAKDNQLLITHGNGPQIGLLAMQSAAYAGATPYPMDVLGAETEGMIGYLIARELHNQIPERNIATLLTQTIVNTGDPAYECPVKFVGPVFTQQQAKQIEAERHWTFKLDGDHYRRVVPSPEPCRILETPVIRQLIHEGVIVVCAGGGGIPVTLDQHGKLQGAEVVVDKDLASAWLAMELQADVLMMLTDVDGVYADWGTPQQRLLRNVIVDELEQFPFPAGSMGPKIEAASRFVSCEGGIAFIGRLEDADKFLDHKAGTRISLRKPL